MEVGRERGEEWGREEREEEEEAWKREEGVPIFKCFLATRPRVCPAPRNIFLVLVVAKSCSKEKNES